MSRNHWGVLAGVLFLLVAGCGGADEPSSTPPGTEHPAAQGSGPDGLGGSTTQGIEGSGHLKTQGIQGSGHSVTTQGIQGTGR